MRSNPQHEHEACMSVEDRVIYGCPLCGKEIVVTLDCPICGGKITIYHTAWSALKCPHCHTEVTNPL